MQETVAAGSVAAALVVTSLLAWSGGAAAQSPGGVPLPAEAGTTWEIVAGYSTATHTGEDPHAIDIIRKDATTAGSLVLSPVSGRVRYVSSDCVSVRDVNGFSHLLCHVWAVDGLARDDVVEQGDLLATVAPPYYANNGGLDHIHYAIHYSDRGGRITDTIPFTGEYALEGVNLTYTGAYNEHAGRQFVSSNGVASSGALASGIEDPTLPEDVLARAEAEPDFLVPGWNLVGWTDEATAEEAAAPIVDAIAALYTYEATTDRFLTYAPGLPPELNDLELLTFGTGVWVNVTNPEGVVWPRLGVVTTQSVSLVEGFNLVTWTPERTEVEAAIGMLGDAVRAVYAWDPTRQRFRVHRLGAPDFLNDLGSLGPGEALWVDMRRAAVWQQG